VISGWPSAGTEVCEHAAASDKTAATPAARRKLMSDM
jgi:hypothetical protein